MADVHHCHCRAAARRCIQLHIEPYVPLPTHPICGLDLTAAFLCTVVSYPFAIVNAFISFSLLYLYTPWSKKKYDWKPPFRATWPVVAFFFLSNVFLAVAPLVPPAEGLSPYVSLFPEPLHVYGRCVNDYLKLYQESLPYWLHVVVAIGVFALGSVIWIVYAVILPRSQGYKLESVEEVGEDGVQRDVFRRKYE